METLAMVMFMKRQKMLQPFFKFSYTTYMQVTGPHRYSGWVDNPRYPRQRVSTGGRLLLIFVLAVLNWKR